MSDKKAKPHPRSCINCGSLSGEVAHIPYTANVRHDGRVHTIAIASLKVDKCSSCGNIVLTSTSDEQISEELRKLLGLLQPAEILAGLKTLGISQKAFAERIGVAEETVSRWVNGFLIQTRALDNLMRVFFAFPKVRDALATGGPSPHLGLTSVAANDNASQGSPVGQAPQDMGRTLRAIDLDPLDSPSTGSVTSPS